MSNAAAYLKAAIPEPYQILGLKLKPFSLGHFMLMARFDCAFAAEEPVPVKLNQRGLSSLTHELLLAVLICSHTYEEFVLFAESPELVPFIKKWRKELGPFNILEKTNLFKSYMAAARTVPKYWEEKDGGRTSGAHWTQCVKLVLMSELGYSETEALNMPLSKAFADYFKHAENNGAIRLMTEDEIEFIAEQEKEIA